MKGFFRNIFHIYPGEERNALLFACLGFFWAFAVSLGLKFADALFLLHIGADSLPMAYAASACLMIILAVFLLKAFHSVSAHRIFIALLLAGVCFYSIAYVCTVTGIASESIWLWFAMRVFGSLFFSLGVTCYWTFVDQYYHLQDAKRLFTLFASAIFTGLATTGFLMRSGVLDVQHLTLLITGLLLLSIYWIGKISAKVKPVYDENVLETSGEQEEKTFKFLIDSIAKSKFTLFLMAGNFLTLVLQVITEYSYLSSFDAYFDQSHTVIEGGEENASLTLFLGQCLASVSVINLIIGLFIYSRLIRRFGITSVVLFTPVVLVLNFAGWSIDNSLIFPIIGFFVVEGMLYTIDDNNFTLLLNAVPAKLKHKIRLIIESFFEPIGMLVSSLLIIFVPLDSKTLGLILAMVLLAIVLLLRRQYLKAIFNNLAENAVHFQRGIRDWFVAFSPKKQKSSERRLLAIMQVGDEREQLLAVEALLGFNDKTVLPKLLQFSEDLTPGAKIFFLQALAQSPFAKENQVIEKLQRWLSHNEPQLQSAIHFYLARQGLLTEKMALEDLNNSELLLQAAGIVSLEANPQYQSIADERLQQLLHSHEEQQLCMGITIIGLNTTRHGSDALIPFLNHDSIKVARSAAAGLAQMAKPSDFDLVPVLIKLLKTASDSELRQSSLRSLSKIALPSCFKEVIESSANFRPNERRLIESIVYNIGLQMVPDLVSITKDIALHDRSRVLAGRILGRLSIPILRQNLYEIVSIEIDRAYFYYYHYHSIPAQYPELDLTLLRDDLLSDFHSVIDFIIQMLGVAGESEDCELLSRSLRNPNPKVRSQVIEALEKTCEPFIFRALYPLIADLPHSEKMQAYLKRGHAPLDLHQLLEKMILSPIQGDQIVAIALQYRLNLPNWRASLKKQLDSRQEIFHHFAYELLET